MSGCPLFRIGLGSVIHEHYPFGLYLLHVGDALVTVLVIPHGLALP